MKKGCNGGSNPPGAKFYKRRFHQDCIKRSIGFKLVDAGEFCSRCFATMARLYSKKKGKSGSKKPEKLVKPTWLTHEPHVVEQLVVKFGKQRMNPGLIGLLLRDSYGVPDVRSITGKSIGTILKEHGAERKIPADLAALIERAIAIMKHLELHKKDIPARRGLQLTENKIRRLVVYYKRNGQLPEEWVYEPEKAKLLLE